MKHPLVYLASPYTDQDPGVRLERAKHAAFAAASLMAGGKVVFSPIAHGHYVAQYLPAELIFSHGFWMKQCETILKYADELAVLQLPGWDTSSGVTAEIKFAKVLGIPVRYLCPETLK